MNKGEIKTKNLIKKMFSILILNVMIISLFAPYSKVYATTGEIEFNLITNPTDITSVNAGDVITLSIQLKNVDNAVNVIDFGLTFDDSILQIDTYRGADAIFTQNGWSIDNKYVNGGDIQFSLKNTNGVYDNLNESIMDIDFKVLQTVNNTDISVTYIEASGAAGNFLYGSGTTVTLGSEQTDYSAVCSYYNETNLENNTLTGTTVTLPTITAKYIDSNGNEWEPVGWKADVSNTNDDIIAGGTTVSLTENTNYYMLYKRNITLSYNTNGGNAMAHNSQIGTITVNTANVTSIGGAKITITTSVPTRTGYTFNNTWNTKSDGTGTTYAKGATNIVFTEDTTLYALWTANTNTAYKVEHYKQGTDGNYPSSPSEIENLTGTTDTVATAIAKTYTGYTEDISNSNKISSGTITGDGSLVLKLYYKLDEHTVVFKDENGNVLDTQTVYYGTSATAPTIPTKPSNAQYTYTFDGWVDGSGNIVDITNIIEDKELYPNFTQTVNQYTVTFYDEDQTTVLGTSTVDYGTTAIAPTTPTKAAVTGHTYAFDKWTDNLGNEDNLTNVIANRSVYATYTDEIATFKVRFFNEGTQIIEDQIVNYGDAAMEPTLIPTKAADMQYTYTFAGWDKTFDNVTSNLDINATYTKTSIEYEIKFLNEDGNELESKSDYHYNDDVIIPSTIPTKAADAEKTYIFAGWADSQGQLINTDGLKVTGDAIYTAKFNETVNQYTVTFYNGDTIVGSSTVNYGETANAPSIPTKENSNGYSYTFIRWTDGSGNTDDLTNVIADRNVYAEYNEVALVYTITYEDTLNIVNPNPTSYTVQTQNITLVPLGEKQGMTFKGWYTDLTYTTEVTSINTQNMENITLYAKWDIDQLMYFVKLDEYVSDADLNVVKYQDESSADVSKLSNGTAMIIYGDFDDAKEYVDNLFNEGNGTALGIFDLNNDLVYWPEVHPKYYVKANASEDGQEYIDFDEAKVFVDSEFANGTILKIYDEKGKLIYEPKNETPKVQYFVKVNESDENTDANTFDKFSEAKLETDTLFANGNNVKIYDINGEVVYEPVEEDELYLKSIVYKIGENKINEYENGDLYLYRVSPNTTLSEFKANCETNGTINIYKQDGSILEENELVGTGMILKDTKDNKEITVQIAVTGDLDGNGISDITDLVRVRRHIQNLQKVENVYIKAGDINEDSSIDITDLVKIRRHIQEIEYIV